MNYVSIDYHKRYSIASLIDEAGRLWEGIRIEGNTLDAFMGFFSRVGGPCEVVIEAGRNWAYLYDLLSGIEDVEEIVLAHPYRTRVIADAQVKTDKLDSKVLVQLLKHGMIAKAHIPSVQTRKRKDLMRQRLFWVRQRTKVRNRVHVLLDRQRDLCMPQVSDLFGVVGMTYLSGLDLPDPDGRLLRQDIEVLAQLDAKIKEIEKRVEREGKEDRTVGLLMSIPGIGKVLANVIAAEIDDIGRFRDPGKLTAYCGLVPTTYASGGKQYHGHLLSRCNKWLKWALIEAAWAAVRYSPYFSCIYRHYRASGKSANKAIVIVARRLCVIVWRLLRENRYYQERSYSRYLPGRSASRLTVHS